MWPLSSVEIHRRYSEYRLIHTVCYMGWVDLDLESSPGWWAATVDAYCPSRMVEHPKSKSFQPRCAITRVTLYLLEM